MISSSLNHSANLQLLLLLLTLSLSLSDAVFPSNRLDCTSNYFGSKLRIVDIGLFAVTNPAHSMIICAVVGCYKSSSSSLKPLAKDSMLDDKPYSCVSTTHSVTHFKCVKRFYIRIQDFKAARLSVYSPLLGETYANPCVHLHSFSLTSIWNPHSKNN